MNLSAMKMLRDASRVILQPLDAEVTAQRLELRNLRQGWVEYVRRYEWDIFATLTPRFSDCTPERLQREMVNGFVRRLAYETKHACPWMSVLERGGGGGVHLHLLAYGTADVSLAAIRRAWTFGHSEVERFDPTLDPSYYLTKTVRVSNNDWNTFESSRRLVLKLEKAA